METKDIEKFISSLKFDNNGLLPVVVQDIEDSTVLMVAYMDKEAILRTINLGYTCFFSRSRKTYWVKGETSGNKQKVIHIFYDCDGDTLLIQVKQEGMKVACHTGNRSCFFRRLF